jgi:hypothetical protein
MAGALRWLLAFTLTSCGSGDSSATGLDGGAGSDTDPSLDQAPENETDDVQTARSDTQASKRPIHYHGGPVMLGAVNLYYIWYGGWQSGDDAVDILTTLAKNVGQSPYYLTNTTYHDRQGRSVGGDVSFAGSVFDAYSTGKALGPGHTVRSIVEHALDGGALPVDESGVYLVLTSADVTVPTFCKSSYAWHDYFGYRGKTLKYGFIGDPSTQCPSWYLERVTPNGNGGADTMADGVTHELSETVTDPLTTSWYDARGMECADKCVYTFGDTYTVANGAQANMKFGGRDYYIEQNWVNEGPGRCGKSP